MALIDFTTTRSSIESYLDTNFSMCPIQFENLVLEENAPTDYIALFDKIDMATAPAMQETTPVCRGVLIINIFTQIGVGTNRAREIAKELESLLGSKAVGGIGFGAGELYGVPVAEGNTYYQHNLNFTYSFVYGGDSDC